MENQDPLIPKENEELILLKEEFLKIVIDSINQAIIGVYIDTYERQLSKPFVLDRVLRLAGINVARYLKLNLVKGHKLIEFKESQNYAGSLSASQISELNEKIRGSLKDKSLVIKRNIHIEYYLTDGDIAKLSDGLFEKESETGDKVLQIVSITL